MSDDYEARSVQVTIDDMGTVKKVQDNKRPGKLWEWSGRSAVAANLVLKGKHFGWDLSQYVGEEKLKTPIYANKMQVCTNKRNDEGHLNTAACKMVEMIMLDVGYWGYFEPEKPQRDFGMIEGKHVWLCSLVRKRAREVNQESRKKLKDKTTLALKLVDRLEAWGYGCKLLSHTAAVNTPAAKGLAKDRLTIIFPDIHLPEKWPDLPRPQDRHKNKEARDLLRRDLRYAQHRPAFLGGIGQKEMPRKRQLAIHEHIRKLVKGQDIPWPVVRVEMKPMITPLPPLPVPIVVPVPVRQPPDMFNRVQFLAEKAILDRNISINCSWFYRKGKKEGEGDASAAVDLVAFLGAIWEVQQENKNKVRVLQVGDLYELWVNREFLYRDFPVPKSDLGVASSAALTLIKKLGSQSFRPDLLSYLLPSNGDLYQYRFGDQWDCTDKGRSDTTADIGKKTRDIRCYVFHEWPTKRLTHRYKIAVSVDPKERAKLAKHVANRTDRLVQQLNKRIDDVKAFSLPVPDNWAADILTKVSSKLLGEKKFKEYWRKNAIGKFECLWNRLILDMFEKVSCTMVYGNHDGYRGDDLINGSLSSNEKAKPWFSELGIWAEHGHRWDEYNRDGMAFGAGVTNLVYYYFRPFIATLDEVKSKVVPSFHTEQIPGAAQWFLLVNYGRSQDWFGSVVKPFGIYVNGHTHTPDLFRVQFRKQASKPSSKSGIPTEAYKDMFGAGKI